MLFQRAETAADLDSLPPCGGSGLKYKLTDPTDGGNASPSMRREWIEMESAGIVIGLVLVSLHAEGVD